MDNGLLVVLLMAADRGVNTNLVGAAALGLACAAGDNKVAFAVLFFCKIIALFSFFSC